MTAIRLDGVATATAMKAELAVRVARCGSAASRRDSAPCSSAKTRDRVSYVTGKHRDCAEVGMESIRIDLPATASADDVRAAIDQLNGDPAVTGFIVQLPLPAGLDENEMLERIDPAKDADGLHPTNLGRLVLGVAGS